MFKKLFDLLEFQEQSAYFIRTHPEHEDHTDYYDERYWHGFEVAIRYAKNRLRDWVDEFEEFVVSPKGREK